MKRLVYSLIALAISACAIAQPNPNDFFVSGYVTDPNTGNAVNGQTVCIYADTSNQSNVVFYHCTTTNANGYYSISVPNGSLTGPNVTYIVYTWDCQNHYMDTTVINGQGSIDNATVNFMACDSTSSYCQADFVWNHGFNGGVFFTYTGTTNALSYYWNFGDGTTSTLQDPSHYYPTTGGPWVATLTISTASGCTSTAYDTIWAGVSNCQASFSYNATPNGVVGFSYNGTNGNNTSYAWDFGDGSTSSVANPTHTYNGIGPWVACVTITTNTGCTSTFCDTVGFNSPPTCHADFTMQVDSSNGVYVVTLQSTSTGTGPLSYNWWVNGAQYSGSSVVHTFANSGDYGICLDITTADSCISYMCDTLFLNTGSGNNCNAYFQYSQNPNGGFQFYTNGNNSWDYIWDFGDNFVSYSSSPTHYYNAPGTYIVCLTVVDSATNCTATYCDSIVVYPTSNNCQANFTVQVDSSNGVYVVTLQSTSTGTSPIAYNWWVDGHQYSSSSVVHTFANQGNYIVCLDITTADSCYNSVCDTLFLSTGSGNNCNAQFQYNISGSGTVYFTSSSNNNLIYSWDFGDNTSATVPNPSHQYNAQGTYMVCLTVNDPSSGCSATYCDTITVGSGSGNNCHANFQAAPDSITLPPLTSNTIFFYDLSTGTPSYWHWDFGDGSSSSSQNPVHTYNSPGIYYVCLTIANFGSNCTSSICDTVVVGNGQTGPCQASFSHSLSPNGGVNFHGYANQNAVQYQWTFGDGSSGTGQNVNHVYASPGTYTVCLTVYNNNGCQDTYCAQVSYGNNSSGFCIAGEVNAGTPNQRADAGLVYLISYDSQTNTLTAIDTAIVDSAGYFSFCQVPGGQYLVKAALTPNSVYYSNYLPTYYGNSLFWNYAQYVTASTVYPFITINLIAGNNPGGPGFVGGDVTQGANKTNGPGDPLESVQVMLLDMNDNPITYVYTDAQGQFSFPDIAYGTYKVYPEVTGINTIPAIVTIDGNTQSITDIHLYQGTTEISTGIASAITEELKASDIYPNPTANEAFITFELTKPADVNIRIYTTTGQLVSDQMTQLGEGIQKVEIKTDDLNGGIYFVQFTEIEGLFNLNKQMILTK